MSSKDDQINHMMIIIENLRKQLAFWQEQGRRIVDLETQALEQARVIAELKRRLES